MAEAVCAGEGFEKLFTGHSTVAPHEAGYWVWLAAGHGSLINTYAVQQLCLQARCERLTAVCCMLLRLL